MANRIIRAGHYWPSLHKDIRDRIASCPACRVVETHTIGFHPARTINAPLPGDHYQIDLAEMPRSDEGHVYLFVLVDVFSGFVMLKPLMNKKTTTIARALLEICSVLGFPRILQSDNGKEFASSVIKSMMSLHGVQHRLISSYNPRADGKVERTVGTVKRTLQKLLEGANRDRYWHLHVPFVQYSYNDKVQDITGATAFSVMLGRLPNDHVSYLKDNFAELPQATDAWHKHQEQLVSLIFPAINVRREDGQDKMRAHMDSTRRHLKETTLPMGTVVMVQDPLYIINPKLRPFSQPKYLGPYTVYRRSPHGPYILKDATGARYCRAVNLDQLKVVYSR